LRESTPSALGITWYGVSTMSAPPGRCVKERLLYHYREEQSRRMKDERMSTLHSTTILAVRHKGASAIGGDGQVTLGNVGMKNDAHKIRKLNDGRVLVGFAGTSADAFALLERFEAKLKDFQGSVPRAATELAKDWRMDRNLRRLEAMIIALDRDNLLLLS